MTTTFTLTVNGEERETAASSVAALLDELGLPHQKIAVEQNLAIVARSAYGATPVADGDRIEIVQFVGGG